MVSSLNKEIDFRVSFDDSDDEDYIEIFDKNSFSYKIISVNDLKMDSENNNEKFNMPSFPPPEPMVCCFDDLDFFNDFENEFPAIVYNDALMSKLDFLTEPTVSPQHIDEFNLKDETSLSECDEKEQNVLNFNDLFPFNVIYPNDSKSDKDNDDDKVDIEHSSGDLSVNPLPDVINTDVGAYTHGSNKLLETRLPGLEDLSCSLNPFVEIPSGEIKVHIEVLSVLWGNRLPIPDGSLPLSSQKKHTTPKKWDCQLGIPCAHFDQTAKKRVSMIERIDGQDQKERKLTDISDIQLSHVGDPKRYHWLMGRVPRSRAKMKGFEAKCALFETMIASKTFNKHPKHKALFHALMESILADEDAMDKGVADIQKKRKPDDADRDEDPPAGPD
ncbi:hypothetical protein Tco_0417050 [Tanacetum coccineum]